MACSDEGGLSAEGEAQREAPAFSRQDREWMRLALRLGRRGLGATAPNPPVGAVIVQGDRCVGSGWHLYQEVLHAEARALEEAGDRARGATCYVTLEPCGHQGRTPPCADALAEAGVARVVYAAADPSGHAGGAGPESLRAAGISVEGGCLAREGEELCRAFLHVARTGRARLIAKAACGPDGRLATVAGASAWISGETSRRLYRRERARHDAVLVGSGTVRRDDPHLGARGVEDLGDREGPAAVVLDGRLEALESGSQLWKRAERGERVVVYTRRPADPARREVLEEAGFAVAEVAVGPGARGVDLEEVARDLAERGIHSVLVEGGGRVTSELFDRRLADAVLLFRAALLLGGTAAPQLWAGRGSPSLEGAPRLDHADGFRLGPDEILEASVRWPDR